MYVTSPGNVPYLRDRFPGTTSTSGVQGKHWKPSSIKACEFGTPVPHPGSRTVAALGNVWDQSATTDPRHPNCSHRARLMNSAATSS